MPSVLFTANRGDDWEWQVQILLDDSDVPITGLSMATDILVPLKRFADDANYAILGQGDVIDDSNALLILRFSNTETAKLTPGFWWSEIAFTFEGAGTIKRTAGPFAIAVRGDLTP